MKAFVKDPAAVLDYSLDWGPWLSADTISNSSWVVESGISIESGSEVFDTTTTGLFISGGVHGENYLVTNQIITTGGKTDERSFQIKVRNR